MNQYSGSVAVRRTFNSWLTAYAEIGMSHSSAVNTFSNTLNSVFLFASAPSNPFTQDLAIAFRPIPPMMPGSSRCRRHCVRWAVPSSGCRQTGRRSPKSPIPSPIFGREQPAGDQRVRFQRSPVRGSERARRYLDLSTPLHLRQDALLSAPAGRQIEQRRALATPRRAAAVLAAGRQAAIDRQRRDQHPETGLALSRC